MLEAQQFAGQLTTEKREELAAQLGLPAECIDSLFYVGWTKDRRDGPCFTFAEHDGDGEIIGVTRRRKDGGKKCIQGGSRGLNITRDWDERDGPVYVVEGASCTLALAAMGLAGIGRPSNVGGVAKLSKLFETVRTDRRIIVMGEWDAKPNGKWPGLDGAKSVAEGLCHELKRPIEWALPPDQAKDTRAWVNAHLKDHTMSGAARLLGQQFADMLEVEVVKPPASKEEEEGMVLRTCDTLEPGVYDWLIPDYLPKGDLILFAGDGGRGKSLVTLDMVAAVTRGEPAFGMSYPVAGPQHCLLMVCEDDTSKVLYPRLLAADAVLSRVHLVEGIRGKDKKMLPFSLLHIDALDKRLDTMSDVGIVLIDPVAAYLAGTNVNPGRDEEVRTLTEPLRKIAWKHGVSVIMVKHFNKGTSPKAASRIADSAVWRNACRAVYVFFPDDEEEGRHLFLQEKIQGAAPSNGFMYRIQPCGPERRKAALDSLPQDWSDEDRHKFGKQLTRIEWVGETDRTPDSVAAALSLVVQEIPGETDGPADFLRKYLENGPALVESAVLAGNTSLAMNRSVKFWRDNVLKRRLGGSSAKARQFQGPWYFCLPGQKPPETTAS